MFPHEIDPRILGQRIAESRKARGKTQEEVAEFLACSRPTYIAIEKGDRGAKADEIVKLASFFGRKVNELVRPSEPVTDLQPHLRAVADKMKSGDQNHGRLNVAIDQLQSLAEDYRAARADGECPAPSWLPGRGRAQPENRSRRASRGRRQPGANEGLTVISCPQLVKTWVDATRPDTALVVQVLTDIQTFAQFRPNSTMPESGWWT